MQSSTDHRQPGQSPCVSRRSETVKRWNRKLHYYVGLFSLLFVWLFSLSGLLLNHSQWKFAEFWDSRKQSTEERDISLPVSGGDLAQARDLMRQLGIRGEIEWTSGNGDGRRLDFRVTRPGHMCEISADFIRSKASLKNTDLNAWGVIRILHTFTGVRIDDSRNHRDWFLTSVWAWTMDLVAVSLILMVLSSYYMWFELPQKRKLGASVLFLGCVCCGLFCFGLRWIY